MVQSILVVDMGGTNIRFAVDNQPVKVYACADYASPYAALEAFYAHCKRRPKVTLWGLPSQKKLDGCANTSWRVSMSTLKKRFGFKEVYFFNDFEAAAWGVLSLPKKDQKPLTRCRMNTQGARVIMGAGTGFGVAVIADKQHVLPSEAGHATLPLYDEQDRPIYELAQKRYGRVSVERILSGSGLELIYQALGKPTAQPVTAPMITQKAQNKELRAVKACERFFAIWGGVAGDVALQTNAIGGVGLTCGIIEQKGMLTLLKSSDFMKMFCNKGRLSKYMQQIPVCAFSSRFVAIKGLRAWYRQKCKPHKKST